MTSKTIKRGQSEFRRAALTQGYDPAVLMEAARTAPAVESLLSSPIDTATGVVWLHLRIRRPSPWKAEATAWTTTTKNPKSKRVTVGTMRLKLDWCGGSEDSTKRRTKSHRQYQFYFPACLNGAKATVWTTGPKIGPLSGKA